MTGDRTRDGIETTLRTRREGVVVAVRVLKGPAKVTLTNASDARARTLTVAADIEREITVETRSTGGWYVRLAVQDNPFVREFAGHLENGRPSISDPASGR